MNIIHAIAFRVVVIAVAGAITMLWPAKAEEASISPAEEPPLSGQVQSPSVTFTQVHSPVVIDTTLQKIAWCESRNRQFKDDGSLLRGVVNPDDVGKFQINEHYHLTESQRLGMDIHTLEGNIEYAKYLYERQGSKPWNWSAHCWGDTNRVWIEKGGELWSE